MEAYYKNENNISLHLKWNRNNGRITCFHIGMFSWESEGWTDLMLFVGCFTKAERIFIKSFIQMCESMAETCKGYHLSKVYSEIKQIEFADLLK